MTIRPADDPSAGNARGAALMTLSMAGFVLNDALMKHLFETAPLFQAMLIRGVVATALLAVIAAGQGALAPRVLRADRPLMALRTLGEVGATVCFLTALSLMPIANAMAVLQALPLTVTLAAALLLREPVGWRRWLAIGVGFLGVAIMLRPEAGGFDAHGLWALAAVGCMTVRDLATRRLSAGAPSAFVALLTAAAITLIGGVVTAFQPWTPVTAGDVALLAAAAVFLLVGYLAGVTAMRAGEIGFVSPFRYSVLLWALLIGWAVFGETPTPTMLLGAAIVAGAGVYTLYRERTARRRRLARPAP